MRRRARRGSVPAGAQRRLRKPAKPGIPAAVSALTRRGDLLDVDVERPVWSKGGRPLAGMLLRFGFAGVFFALALAISEPFTRIIFVAFAVAVLLLLVPIMDGRLAAMGAAIAAADRPRAAKWLTQLEQQRIVTVFAPHAWVALQRGRLHLVLGNGRAAAKAFADCARISGHTDLPALVSAQAHALLLAGDRKDARALLGALDAKSKMTPRDQLDLGIALLEESGRTNAARTHLEAAREHLGGHPRLLAGLALAYARSDAPTEGLPLLEAAQAADEGNRDELAAELMKRARKALRPALDAAEKRERRAQAAASLAARSAGAVPAPTKRKEKKERRKDRREQRREPGGVQPVETPGADAKASADAEAKRTAEDDAAKQRAEDDAAKQRADAEAQQRAKAETRRRAEAEAAASRRAEEAAAAARRAAEEAAAAERRRAEEAAAVVKREADELAAVAKREAEQEAAAKRRAAEEADAARRRAAASGPKPTFLAPPLPPTNAAPPTGTAPPSIAAPSIAVPSITAAPSIAAPPVAPAAAAPPSIDASGWDDLLGDVPAPPSAEPKKT